MAKIKLSSLIGIEDQRLRDDLKTVEQTINLQQERPEIDAVTADPSGLATSTGKLVMWFRSDLLQLRFIYNGTTYKIQASAA